MNILIYNPILPDPSAGAYSYNGDRRDPGPVPILQVLGTNMTIIDHFLYQFPPYLFCLEDFRKQVLIVVHLAPVRAEGFCECVVFLFDFFQPRNVLEKHLFQILWGKSFEFASGTMKEDLFEYPNFTCYLYHVDIVTSDSIIGQGFLIEDIYFPASFVISLLL